MAFDETSGSNMVMPVGPVNGNGGFGGFGDGGWWILLLFILLGNGGWGNSGGFGGSNMYPWMNQSAQISNGFQNAALGDQLTGIQAGITAGFAGVTNQLYNDTIASLERSYAAQTASTAGFSGLQGQLAQCCCDNRLATCQTQNLVSTESAATRSAIQSGVQAVLDKMCEQELDAYRRENDNLRAQVNMQKLAASQAAQTAALIADNTAQTQYIVNRVAPYPIPAYTVANPITPATTTAG